MPRLVLTASMLLFWFAKGTAQTSAVDDPWRPLAHRSAWVLLGVVRAENTVVWASVPNYEFVGAPPSDAWPAVPKRGDVIKFKSPDSLMILDYRISGEELLGVSSTSRARSTPDDYTGIKLPEGSVVIVDEVTEGPILNRLAPVWVRVRPKDQ